MAVTRPPSQEPPWCRLVRLASAHAAFARSHGPVVGAAQKPRAEAGTWARPRRFRGPQAGATVWAAVPHEPRSPTSSVAPRPQVTYGSFDYTSLLYLSDYLDDFGGGRFVFVEEGANKTVEPRAGRTSRGGPGRAGRPPHALLPSVTAATAQRSPESPGPPARQGHPELPCECVPSLLACVGKDSQRLPGEPGHLVPGPRHAVPCCHVSPVVWHRLWEPSQTSEAAHLGWLNVLLATGLSSLDSLVDTGQSWWVHTAPWRSCEGDRR